MGSPPGSAGRLVYMFIDCLATLADIVLVDPVLGVMGVSCHYVGFAELRQQPEHVLIVLVGVEGTAGTAGAAPAERNMAAEENHLVLLVPDEGKVLFQPGVLAVRKA